MAITLDRERFAALGSIRDGTMPQRIALQHQ
jgi:hypothetical protein